MVALPAKPVLGFVGLGRMGLPMAANLLSKAVGVSAAPTLHVYDVSPAAAAALRAPAAASASAATSVQLHASPRSLAEHCDVVISMLPAGPNVRDAYLHPDRGILAGVMDAKRTAALLLDCSTVDPDSCKTVAAATAEKLPQAAFLDAPVSGGTQGASDGTLTFLVGAPPSSATFAAARDTVLAHMGRTFLACGAVGAGIAAKITNNMLLAVSMVAAAEAMNLGVRLGLDPKLLASVLNSSSGRSWSTELYNPHPGVLPTAPASRDYEGGFAAALMAKDLRIALDAARAARAKTPLADEAKDLYDRLAGDPATARKDFSVVYRDVAKDASA
ncbi:hypothetical protein HK405_005813 [Cladochytrium tenue]|nr:hypothetical protein HK405_005813 [Cladochytrium tenue]